jgi:integrase/recombinase XerC
MAYPARSPMREHLCRFAYAQRSERTAKTYASIVGAFLLFLRRQRPQRRDVEQFLALPLRSGARASVATRNQALAAVRAFAQFATREGLWPEDPTRELAFQREPEKDPAVLYVPEVRGFFRAIPEVSPPGLQARDRAILAMLFTAGVRVAELVRLDESQVDLTSAVVVAVRRKGGRTQDLPLAAGAVHLLRAWFAERAAIASPSDPALFVSRRGARLSVRSVQRLFARVREHVGTAKHATPHTARHTFITLALAHGADVTVVSRVAGHASVTTTMRYRHLVDSEPRAAVATLGVVIPPELGPDVPAPEGAQEIPAPGHAEGAWTNNVTPANDSLDAQDHLDDIQIDDLTRRDRDLPRAG